MYKVVGRAGATLHLGLQERRELGRPTRPPEGNLTAIRRNMKGSIRPTPLPRLEHGRCSRQSSVG